MEQEFLLAFVVHEFEVRTREHRVTINGFKFLAGNVLHGNLKKSFTITKFHKGNFIIWRPEYLHRILNYIGDVSVNQCNADKNIR